jgi:hypothetical protein
VKHGRLLLRVGRGEPASGWRVSNEVFDVPTRDHWPAFSGAPPARTMHVRSVFHVAEATRLPAAAPTS